MIEIERLGFSYGKKRIFSDISMTVEAGECVGILGINGAGKSTLITCINKIRTPDCGSVKIDGRCVSDMSRGELAQSIAYVAQMNELSCISVFDCVLLGRKPYIKWGVSQEDIDICADMIRRVGLDGMQLRNIDELSGGEAQKVMLARALVQQPKLLLLDEPTSNLDPKNQYGMLNLVRELAKERGISVLIVLHDLNLALRYCDRFFFMKDGTGCRCGGVEIVDEETIESVYGIHADIIEHGARKIVVIE